VGIYTPGDGKLIHPDSLLIVDCLLPAQTRQLGTRLTYLSPRRPIRTSAATCAMKGGEYIAHDQADFSNSLAIWLPLAERGDPEAQTYVGEIYEYGLGTDESFSTAAYWFQLASEQNYARAMINLGYLYESGLGVKKDLAKALNLYRDASGFTDGSLEYVSSLENENREAAKIKAEFEKQHLQELENKLANYKQKIQQQEKDIKGKAYTISALESEIGNQDNIEALESDLMKRSEEFDQKNRTLEALQKELGSTRQQLQTLKKRYSDEASIKNPSIEIIDPPLTVKGKQGLPIIQIKNSAQLVGKISPVNSVFALHVNSMDHEYSNGGLFKYQLDQTTPDDVEITAIDQSGNSTRLALRIEKLENHTQSALEATASSLGDKQPNAKHSLNFGNYHALLIGNDDYQQHDDLTTAGHDITTLGHLLKESYNFDTQILHNASRYEIISALDQLRSTLKASDNLLIYFSGHGVIDNEDTGYWLPVDAKENERNTWIENKAITNLVDAIAAKHVLLVSDSIYSGTLSRSSIARPLPQQATAQKRRWLQAVSKSRVRTVLSSGSTMPQSKFSGNADHSVFANALINSLKDNKNILEAYSLYLDVQQEMSNDAGSTDDSQSPYYSPLKHAGHEAGEFLFVPAQP
jgi:hypothetical protein